MQRELLSLLEASWIPIVKKEEDLRLKKWETNLLYIGVDPVASCKLGKKSLNSFYKGHSWHLVAKTGVDRFEKSLYTKITGAFFSDLYSNVFTSRSTRFENFKFVLYCKLYSSSL